MEYTTLREGMPISFSFLRMTFANGHTDVRKMSSTRKAVASSLFPVPMQLTMGVPALWHSSANSNLDVTVSMASTT